MSELNSESIQIRVGVEADAPALAAFAARTFEETFAADNRPEDVRDHLVKAFAHWSNTGSVCADQA